MSRREFREGRRARRGRSARGPENVFAARKKSSRTYLHSFHHARLHECALPSTITRVQQRLSSRVRVSSLRGRHAASRRMGECCGEVGRGKMYSSYSILEFLVVSDLIDGMV
jgi:hypothetical protein